MAESGYGLSRLHLSLSLAIMRSLMLMTSPLGASLTLQIGGPLCLSWSCNWTRVVQAVLVLRVFSTIVVHFFDSSNVVNCQVRHFNSITSNIINLIRHLLFIIKFYMI